MLNKLQPMWNKLQQRLPEHLPETVSVLLVAVFLAITSLVVKETATSVPLIFLIGLGFLLLIVLFVFIVGLTKSVSELLVAPKITYYDIYGDHGRDLVFEEADKIIQNAKEKILALNWYTEERPEPGKPGARVKYFSDLLKKSEQVSYQRVIQSDSYWRSEGVPNEGVSNIADIFDQSYVDHFKEMLDVREKLMGKGRADAIELLVVPPSVPSTFIIVDGRFLIWQLIEIQDPKPGNEAPVWQIRGAIVVHDPRGKFIENFEETFHRVQAKNHRTVDRKDLEKTPPSPQQ